jgi:uncharacterized protein YqhQ
LVRLAAHIQLLPVLENGEETLVGGQAVMEGVMMRAPHSYCVAVRKPSGEIVTEEHRLERMSEKYPIFKLPLFRGVGMLGQAMSLGMKALQFSANAALDQLPAGACDGEKPKGPQLSTLQMGISIAFSLVFFIVLYKLIPLELTRLVERSFPAVHGNVLFNLVDGGIRIVLFLGFLYLLSRFRDIHRVFEYHGAEHRVVFNFESGRDVNVPNAQSFETWHPRCGTSFLLVVMVLAMPIYMLLPFDSFLLKFLARIALLPVVAGLSYEVIRYAARSRRGLLALLTAPGLWLQRITTQPPADGQTAVAIRALEGAMALEKEQGGELVIA